MNAEIIAVGSELLTPAKVDTNSLYLTQHLNTLGVEVVQKSIVGDDRARLTDAIASAHRRSDLVILTGGLGPTEDDLTRDAVAAATGRQMRFEQAICDTIAARFARLNRKMVEINKRQAYVIEGAEVLPNERGTAPGQWVEVDGRVIVLLPGPPRELTAMFEGEVMPRLERMLPPQVIRTVCLRVSGMPESDLDQLISPIYTKYANPVTTILAAAGDIQIHLRARCSTCEEADTLLAEVQQQIEPLLGDRVYTRTGKTLEETVGDLLVEKSQTVAVAESCTGGLVGQRITSVAGSSGYFIGGFLTYTDAAKTSLLGVDAQLIAEHTAVSEPVARAMAERTRVITGAAYGL